MRGHAGRGVHFQQPETAIAIAHHVHATPAVDRQGSGRPRRESAERLLVRIVLDAGTEVARVVGNVLGVIVVVLASRHDADAGQCLAVDHRNRQFIADDQAFDQQLAVVARSQLDGGRHVRCVEHAADADTGTLTRRLHHHRQTNAGDGSFQILIGARMKHGVRRGRQPDGLPHLLAAHLVHRQRRTQHATAGERHAQRAHRTLQHTILATASMQDVEHAVDAAGADRVDQRRNAVHADRIHAARTQRFQYAGAGLQ